MLISRKLLNIAGSHLEDTCIVFADSLRGDAGHSDRVVQLYALDPKASETRVLKIPVHEAISVNSEFNTLRVTDRHGQEAEFEEIVVTEPVAPGDSRVRHYVLAFFTQPLDPPLSSQTIDAAPSLKGFPDNGVRGAHFRKRT